MRRRSIWLRAGLLYLLYVNASVGLWATIAPRSFYDDFPGGGRMWVSLDGPYNEHLIRDVGAWSLGMAVVVTAALWALSRPLVLTTGVAATVLGLPHVIYHARHSDVFESTGDKLVSIGGLLLSVLVGLGVAIAALRSPAEDTLGVDRQDPISVRRS
ncbi:MAG: hypothetical protein WKF43_11070 [Acidimicrobiales bacterium]